jgi:hypothetical protein
LAGVRSVFPLEGAGVSEQKSNVIYWVGFLLVFGSGFSHGYFTGKRSADKWWSQHGDRREYKNLIVTGDLFLSNSILEGVSIGHDVILHSSSMNGAYVGHDMNCGKNDPKINPKLDVMLQ